jgi:hypothetical protein
MPCVGFEHNIPAFELAKTVQMHILASYSIKIYEYFNNIYAKVS